MAMNNKNRGFALLIAVIFMSVMLSFGLALGSLSYKQQVLASTAIESQYAFYVADAALECALFADQQSHIFTIDGTYVPPPPSGTPDVAPPITCDAQAPLSTNIIEHNAERWVIAERLSLDSDKRCADVTVYKYSAPRPPNNTSTYIFSQGYDVSCATVAGQNGARFVSRGLKVQY